MEYLNVIVALQIVFFFFLLFFKNENVLNKLLAVIILIPGFNFISNTINLLGIFPDRFFAIMFFTVQATGLLFAPLVFYYVSLMCGKRQKLTNPLFLVTVGIILYTCFIAFNFFNLESVAQEKYVQSLKSENPPNAVLINNLLFVIMQQVYFTISAIKVKKFKKKLHNVFSSRSHVKIEFTQKFILFIWALNIISLILYATIPMNLVEFVVLPFVLFIINSFLVYYAFREQVVFDKDTYAIFLRDIQLAKKNEKGEIGIRVSEKQVLSSGMILSFLEKNESYLNQNYTIFDLSRALGYSQQLVSSVINKDMNQSFSKLINYYRVETSKILLKEKSNTITIDAIANLSGFKSRASFYRAFKNETGKTPSQYIKT